MCFLKFSLTFPQKSAPRCTPAALQFSPQNTNTGRRCGSSAEALQKRCGNGAEPPPGTQSLKRKSDWGGCGSATGNLTGDAIFDLAGKVVDSLAERVRMRVRNGSGYALGLSLTPRFHGYASGDATGTVRNFKSRDGAEPVRNRFLEAVPHRLQGRFRSVSWKRFWVRFWRRFWVRFWVRSWVLSPERTQSVPRSVSRAACWKQRRLFLCQN